LGTSAKVRGALLATAIVSLLSFGSGQAAAEPLALPQVLESSLRNNGELAAFRQEKGLREAAGTRASLLPNPTLELEGGTGALTGSSAENSLSVGVSQEFYLAGKRAKRLKLAEQELEIYRWQLADRERVLSAEVKNAFYDVILAEKRIALAERATELNRQLFEVARERLAAGDIPELEMNLVKVELARSEGAKIHLVKAVQQNRAALFALMGLPVSEDPAIAGNFAAEVPQAKSLAELRQLARDNRQDLKALGAEKERGESELVLAGAEGVPNLTAGLFLTRDATSIEVGGVEGKDTAYIIGLKLSIPIPVFDRNQAAVQEAAARSNSTQSRLAGTLTGIEREVDTAYAGFENANKVLALYRASIIPQLGENLQLTQEAYRLGEVGLLSVLQEQRNFIEVNDGYLTALHDRQAALSQLESAVAIDLNGGEQ